MSEKTMELAKKEELGLEKVERPQRLYIPRVDIQDGDDNVVLFVEMPGVKEHDVDVTLEKNNLTIIGKANNYSPEGFKRVYSEYRVGGYKRTFIISDEIDLENIHATLSNGVLRLTLYKAEEAKARKIAVKVEA